MNSHITRRTFLKSSGLALVALGGIQIPSALAATFDDEIGVPFSSGSGRARTKVPALATDCHHHIYDSTFKVDPNATLRPPDATIADYRMLQKRIGTSRNVVVQPSTYGVYNDGLVEVLKEFGLKTTRGVAVVNTSVTDAELERLDAVGVRGIRFNLAQAGATTMDMVAPLAERVGPMGWHLQINASIEQIGDNAELWDSIPAQVVFDHLGHLPPVGISHPTFAVIVALMQKGKAWVKLSGAYIDSKVGPPTYADSTVVAKAFVKAAPGRLVWGSDWPHPTSKLGNKPNDALLLDLLAEWVPDEALRSRILVDNPAQLYGF
ncbi:MAG: amidohydrolase family protein [Negativicutes bacterium]|nr:amidohydrolase family protein [Negativicutes bacterium]